MTSSRFNRRPVPRRRPAICIAPAGSCLPDFDPRRPPNLYGLVHWKDLDPISPMDAAGLIITGPRTPGGTYAGHIHLDDVILGTYITDSWPTPSVTVQIYYQDPFWGYQPHNFAPVAMPLDQPFNTRLLQDIFIHGIDYREAWFNA